MSINFNGTNSKLEATNSPFGTAFPFSIFCWIKPSNITTGMVAGVGDTTLAQESAIYIETGKARPFQTGTLGNGGATYSAQSVSATWQPVLVVFESATSRRVYYGSGAVVTAATDIGANNIASAATWLRVGVRPSSGLIPYGGDIEDLAFWRAALTQTDFDALRGGASPASIATGLLEHWPLSTQAATQVGAVNSYVLTASNTAQGSTSRPAGGIAAPVITTHPANQSVSAPLAATFTVVASGSPTSYQWQRSTNSGGAWSNISGATAASYTTPATSVTGGSANSCDQYRCTASNAEGSATSNAATLTVSVAAATATSLSGPTGGGVGAASAAFTVGANGAITGTVAVTPSDGGGGGTFSPTSVAISSGTPTAAFTYTPGSVGTKTISISDDGSLTDAASLTYTVTATAGTVTVLDIANGSGSLLASTTLPNVVILNRATRALVLALTDQVTTAGADLAITNGALVAGTAYMVFAYSADGTAAGAWPATAT